MIKHIVIAAVAMAGISFVQPAGAQDVGVGVGVGPAGVGVTVGSGRGDRYRDREVIREREYRDRGRDETVVIKRQRDYDPDRRVIIEARALLIRVELTGTASHAEAVLFCALNNAAAVR